MYAQAAPAVLTPSADRFRLLRRVGVLTAGGLGAAAVIGFLSTLLVAPAVYSTLGGWGGVGMVLGTFFFAHYVCRSMVYGSAKLPGFILAVVAEGVSFGFLILQTMAIGGVGNGMAAMLQALSITAAAALGLCAYTWFNRSELSWVRGALVVGTPALLVAMVLTVFFPIGGAIGLVLSLVFVAMSVGSLLYRLNFVMHELDDSQHIEGAYEITMAVLVLFWNVLSTLNRLRR